MQVVGYPQLQRTGLANMLFTWARCYLWCKDQNVPMIAPHWTKLRLGPYLRRERDKRNYQFLFSSEGYVNGLKREIILRTSSTIPESSLEKGLTILEKRSGWIVVRFSGMDCYFDRMYDRASSVHEELKRITRPEFREPSLPVGNDGFVGIHVRLGDFGRGTTATQLRSGKHNLRLPLQWYSEALQALREKVGSVPACVFSDGSDEELDHLLRLPAVYRVKDSSTITELLGMAKSSALIASGSTFSMWASFLGQVPTIWYPGQRRDILLRSAGPDGEFEPEWDMGIDLDSKFTECVGRRISGER